MNNVIKPILNKLTKKPFTNAELCKTILSLDKSKRAEALKTGEPFRCPLPAIGPDDYEKLIKACNYVCEGTNAAEQQRRFESILDDTKTRPYAKVNKNH